MTPANDIVTLTFNPALDQGTTVERVVPEKKLRCSRPGYEPGGGGINVSRALRRLGGDSLAVFPAGGDTGRHLQAMLDEEQVRHLAVPVRGWTRMNLSVEETATQQDYRFVMPGPQMDDAESRACIDAVTTLAPAPKIVVASGSLCPGVPSDVYAGMTATLKPQGVRIVLDSSGDALRLALEAGVFLVKPNLNELRWLAGDELVKESEQETFVRSMIDRGWCEAVLASLGAAGALFMSRDETLRMRSPAVPIRSRVGAGDSTVAGMVLALMGGASLREAAMRAVAAGAAAVMTPGSELCRRSDADRLYEDMRRDPAYAV